MNLASDNVSGASRQVLDAIVAANAEAEPAYGADSYTKRAEAMLSDLFERPVASFLVATGTAANALALSALTPPWGAVVCHEESHVIDDECGAPEMFTAGAKLVGIPGEGGLITAEGLAEVLDRLPRGIAKTTPAAALSLSQVTESGTIYQLADLVELAGMAHARGLKVHLDGARFANAMVALGCTPAQMTWKAGIDVVSFGATKNGCLACEAVVFFDSAVADHFAYRRKRSGHTLSKGRILGAQMLAYLDGGHWIANGRRANAAAARLRAGLEQVAGFRFPWPTQANEIFMVVPRSVAEGLSRAGIILAPWTSRSLPPGFDVRDDERFLRLVTSFATTNSDVEIVLSVISSVARQVAEAP